MEKINFNKFPELITERLILRQPNSKDSKSMYLLRSNKKINELISRKIPQSILETTRFIAELNKRFKNKKNIFWVIVSKEHNQIIGTIGYQNFNNNFSYAEIGYELHPDYHNKGYMNESFKAILNFGFCTMNLKIIEAFTHKDNEASKILLKKHQFVFQVKRNDEGFENNRIFKLKKQTAKQCLQF
jgi:ribosomal-protein-alanine N-acetyltransferase|tara:strand:- start:698 stop:1255 length:558 start_codon:yes stop_codon:yes gene_type:complete